MKFHLCLCLLLTSLSWTSAADYYVAPGGNDAGSGSKTHPWKTVQKAAASLQPGDTAHVLPGVYREKIKFISQGSKEGGSVTLQAEGKVVLSGSGSEGEHMMHLEDRSYVRIIGFEIRDHLKVKDGSGIRVEGSGSHIELRGNHIHEIRGKDAMGITIYGTHPTQPVSQVSIIGNEIHDCEAAQSEALTLNGNVTDFKITGNVIRDVNNIGICMIGGEDWINTDRTQVTRNGICSDNKVLRAKANYGDGYAAGIYVDGGANIIIENNEVTDCNLGIEVGAENKGTITRGIIVRKNRIWKNEKAGLVFGGYDKSTGKVMECSFLNNLCYHNDQHEDKNGELWMQIATANTVKGNIFWAGKEGMMLQAVSAASANIVDENTWFTEAGMEDATFVWRGEDLTGFATYQKITGLDANSLFTKPALSAAEKSTLLTAP